MSLWSSKKAPSGCEAQCPECGVTLSRLADMHRHRRAKHPDGTETKFPCPWFGCGYEATHKCNLKSHLDARHSDEPKYPCPECHRPFADAAARIRHRKKLHGYVPYHTKEYIARLALNRKERVAQGASKAVSNKSHRQQPEVALTQNVSSSVPPPTPKLPEVAYHDDFWKMPVDITHSYFPQPLPSQDVPLFSPFETWPGYDTANTIQPFPSAVPSQSIVKFDGVIPPSDFTADYYSNYQASGLHCLAQRYTMHTQGQEFGESFAGDHGMPPHDRNRPWNWLLQ